MRKPLPEVSRGRILSPVRERAAPVLREGASSIVERMSGATTPAGRSTPMPARISRLCRTMAAENAVAVAIASA